MLIDRYQNQIKAAAEVTAKQLKPFLDAEICREIGSVFSEDGRSLASVIARWRLRARVSAYGSLFSGFFLLGLSCGQSPARQILFSHLAIGSAVLAKIQGATDKESTPIAIALAKVAAAQAAMQLVQISQGQEIQLNSAAVPVEAEELKPAVQLFDWSLFESKPDKYPHLAIVGASGDGKSTLATYLATKVFSGDTIVVAPHWKPGDWEGLKVFGKARNYGSKEDDAANFSELLKSEDDSISAASVIKAIYEEMDRRYRLYSDGIDSPTVNIILDEFLAITGTAGGIIEYCKPLWREARKVRLRLILLIQDDAVESLDIKGQGAIRKNLKYVRLGEFAQSHARKLKDEGLIKWVNSCEFPCLVENVAAVF